ncbi:MAG: hypothetical protein CR960_01080 [Pasteurellales bacterium]|nr:MAG: hypothetical protein CR960_01080 [Pasteurellales bacterium]
MSYEKVNFDEMSSDEIKIFLKRKFKNWNTEKNVYLNPRIWDIETHGEMCIMRRNSQKIIEELHYSKYLSNSFLKNVIISHKNDFECYHKTLDEFLSEYRSRIHLLHPFSLGFNLKNDKDFEILSLFILTNRDLKDFFDSIIKVHNEFIKFCLKNQSKEESINIIKCSNLHYKKIDILVKELIESSKNFLYLDFEGLDNFKLIECLSRVKGDWKIIYKDYFNTITEILKKIMKAAK